MITNMSNKPYKLLQLAYLYPLLAIGVNMIPGSDAYICQLCRLLAFVAVFNFVFDIYRLARQFLAFTGRTFWIRPNTTLSSSIVL
jgi:hypothetical protein